MPSETFLISRQKPYKCANGRLLIPDKKFLSAGNDQSDRGFGGLPIYLWGMREQLLTSLAEDNVVARIGTLTAREMLNFIRRMLTLVASLANWPLSLKPLKCTVIISCGNSGREKYARVILLSQLPWTAYLAHYGLLPDYFRVFEQVSLFGPLR